MKKLTKLVLFLILIWFSCTKDNPEKKSSEAKILTYAIKGVDFKINEGSKTIEGTLPIGTDKTKLIAKFTISPNASIQIGNKEQVSETTQNDFTSPVKYVVKAEDGTKATYTITVKVKKSSEAKILTYTIKGVNFKINESSKTIEGTLPIGTDKTKLIAKFTISVNASIQIGDKDQVSETTQNDFTNPVKYVVKAEDGTEATYTVTVKVKTKSSEALIKEFKFLKSKNTSNLYADIIGQINNNKLEITLTIQGGGVVHS